MYNILCYGDSNTFGTNPNNGGRWDFDIRWTGRLQKALMNDGYRIIEEGCGGRTTMRDDDIEPNKNGMEYIHQCLASHKPLDLIILMLGTNDMKCRFNLTPEEIAHGAEELIKVMQNYNCGVDNKPVKILLVSPIHIGEGMSGGMFDEKSVETSHHLRDAFEKTAQKYNCYFLDAAEYAEPSKIDLLHMDENGHSSLAIAMENKIREIFG